jgi:hypothetical protein
MHRSLTPLGSRPAEDRKNRVEMESLGPHLERNTNESNRRCPTTTNELSWQSKS